MFQRTSKAMGKFYTNYTWHAVQKFFPVVNGLNIYLIRVSLFLEHLLFSTKIDFHGSHNFQVLK